MEGNGRYEGQGHSLLFRRGPRGGLARRQWSDSGCETSDQANPARLGDWVGIPDMRKIKYSRDVDALPIELSDKEIDYAEEEGQMIIHFSKDGEPVLLEILDAKDFILNSLSNLVKEKEIAIP
jgi:uncharacterized protein YuzE